MTKEKTGGVLPAMGSVLCFFVVFLHCLGILSGSSWRLSMLVMPAMWLVLGLCLLFRRKNWLVVLGLLPLTVMMIQSAWYPVPMGNVEMYLNALLCRILPLAAYVVLFLFAFLSCLNILTKLRRELWLLPILFVLPGCIWQHANTLPWAQFGVIICLAIWLRPAAK